MKLKKYYELSPVTCSRNRNQIEPGRWVHQRPSDEAIYTEMLTEWRYAPTGSRIFRDLRFMESLVSLQQKIGPDVAARISNFVGHANQSKGNSEFWADIVEWVNGTGKYGLKES